MSYILEALEKSEKERKERAVPNLQTQHTVYPGMTRSRRIQKERTGFRPAVIFALALISCAWILRDHLPMEMEFRVSRQLSQQEVPVASPAQEILPEQHVSPIPPQEDASHTTATGPMSTAAPTSHEYIAGNEKEEPAWEVIQPRQPDSQPTQEEPIITRDDIRLQPAPILLDRETSPENALIPIPYMDELPTDFQRQLPILKFAGHTYAQEPGQRLLIINNSISREGDLVEPGLHLKEITWDGVILEYRGTSFQVRTTGL